MLRILIIASALILVSLQYRLWFGDAGYFAVRDLRAEVGQQNERNTELFERNRLLAIEVFAYKDNTDFSIIEDRARSELGMIKEDETFFLVPGSPD